MGENGQIFFSKKIMNFKRIRDVMHTLSDTSGLSAWLCRKMMAVLVLPVQLKRLASHFTRSQCTLHLYTTPPGRAASPSRGPWSQMCVKPLTCRRGSCQHQEQGSTEGSGAHWHRSPLFDGTRGKPGEDAFSGTSCSVWKISRKYKNWAADERLHWASIR